MASLWQSRIYDYVWCPNITEFFFFFLPTCCCWWAAWHGDGFFFLWPELPDWHSMPAWLTSNTILLPAAPPLLTAAFAFCRHFNFLIGFKEPNSKIFNQGMHILNILSGLFFVVTHNSFHGVSFSISCTPDKLIIDYKTRCLPSLSTVASNKGTNCVISSAIWFKFWRTDNCKAGCPSYGGADNGQVLFFCWMFHSLACTLASC